MSLFIDMEMILSVKCQGSHCRSCGSCRARVSATLQVFTPERFLMAQLVDWKHGDVHDALGVLGDDRVVPIVLRVLVSWWKEE